jgi:hypothetical protein
MASDEMSSPLRIVDSIVGISQQIKPECHICDNHHNTAGRNQYRIIVRILEFAGMLQFHDFSVIHLGRNAI